MGQTTPVTRVGAVLATSLGLLLAGGAAQAAVHQHGDAYGDTSSRDVSARSLARSAAPVEGLADITSLVVNHGYETVDTMVEMGSLQPTGDVVALRVRLQTPSGNWVVRVADVRRGRVFSRHVKLRTTGSKRALACEGLTGSMDYDLDSVTVRVPRTCLGGDPAWVRVGATSRVRDGGTVQLDDAQRDGTAPRRTTLSRRIVA